MDNTLPYCPERILRAIQCVQSGTRDEWTEVVAKVDQTWYHVARIRLRKAMRHGKKMGVVFEPPSFDEDPSTVVRWVSPEQFLP